MPEWAHLYTLEMQNVTLDKKRQADAIEIEITPQMIEAGAIRLSELDEASSTHAAEEVFLAMWRVSPFRHRT